MTLLRTPTPSRGVAAPADVNGDPVAPADSRWAPFHAFTAAVGMLLLGRRTNLQQWITVGYLAALVLLPLWISAVQHHRGGSFLMSLGLVIIVSGVVQSQIASKDHITSTIRLVETVALMLGLLGGVGVILWGRRVLGDTSVTIEFGAGLLLGVSSDGALFAANPWRFGFSLAVMVIALGFAQPSKRRWLEPLILVALTGASAVTDALSSSATLLCGLLFAWQLRPAEQSKWGSATRVVVRMAVPACVENSVSQARIVVGYVVAATQQRSIKQIQTSGSLILGGRPEIAAAPALMADRPAGFGGGTKPRYHEVLKGIGTRIARRNASAILLFLTVNCFGACCLLPSAPRSHS